MLTLHHPPLILPERPGVIAPSPKLLKPFAAGVLINPYAFGAAAPNTSYGNPQGSPTVTTNITPSSGAVANVVDGVIAANSTNAFKMASASDSLKWIMYDFGVGVAKCIDGVKWCQDASNDHDDWLWAATNDDITFVELTQFTQLGSGAPVHEFLYTNPYGFRKYLQWQKPGSLLSTVPWNEEIQFKIDNASPYTAPTNVYSYMWKYGNRDRSALITITTTSGTGGGTLSNLVDGAGDAGSGDSWFFSGGQTGRSFRVDFGTAVKLSESTWWQDNGTSQGTWQPSWSDDGSTTTNFGSPVTLGGTAISTQDLSAMPAAHRYVHFLQVTGTTSSSPWIREWLFKGGMS